MLKSDRLACVWLIRSHIDPRGEIRFVPDQDIAALTAQGINTFDAEHAKFKHLPAPDGSKYGEQCTFQALVESFALAADHPALAFMGQILYASDIGHRVGIFEPKEGYGLWAIAQGLALTIPGDEDRIRTAMPLFDALYAYCRELLDHAQR